MKKLLHLSMLLFATINFGQSPIYQFNFNGNLNNSGSGTVTSGFVPNGTVFYSPDRFGVANRAFNSSTQVAGAILPDLPIGSSARTLNLWVKFDYNAANFTHYLMSWGKLGGGLESAFAVNQSNTTAAFYTGPTVANFTNNINTTSWLMYTYTYDGTVLKHYINGVLKSSVTRNIATVAGSAGNRLSLCRDVNDSSLRIGAFYIDEASIYNLALTQAQITSLYSATSSFPVISNVTATNITFNAATINFNLNAFGSVTTYVVEYTTDVLAPWQTQNGGTTSVNTSAPFQVQLTNLMLNQPYFVRIRATNANGQVSLSPDIQFDTLRALILTNVSDSIVTATTAQINYTLNTNGFSTLVEVKYQVGTIFDSDSPFTTVIINTALTNNAATNYNYTITGLSPNTTYSYLIGVAATNGYSDQAGDNFITASALSLDDNKQRLNFSMYPNPASSAFKIELATEIQSVEIYSLQGQKVLSGSEKQINVSNLASGIYMVRVQDVDGAVATQKLMKN